MKVPFDTDKLRKIAEFVGAVKPELSKVAQREQAIAARAPQVVDTLIAQGLLSPHLKAAKVKALIENPAEILDTLDKTAALVAPVTLGNGDEKSAEHVAPTADQAFEDRLMR